MTNEETDKLLQLRKFLIDYYSTLDFPDSTTAILQQKDVAAVLSSGIKSIEELLKDNIKFV
tara:strand:+ start:325 stop:507 length:183 start_codon:yes stop_codon:yes gene_type:complete